MLGILYLIISIGLGRAMVMHIFPKKINSLNKENNIWFYFSVYFGCGVLVLTWAAYWVSYAACVYGKIREPLWYGNLVSMAIACLIILFWGRRKIQNCINDKKRMKMESIFFCILFLFITWTMFYVCFVKDGCLYAGFTVFGDYAPHTAMMRSFSWGNNFPTQYPHFGGEDVKYHFMFQFLAGNLEYLGLRIDLAFNFISMISLLGFLMLLYTLTYRIFGNFLAGVCACVLFFFRSSFSVIRFFIEHIQAGDLWNTLKQNTTFIGYSQNENWGLWTFNVYLNQRHLAFGLLIVSIAVILYWDSFQKGFLSEKRGIFWLQERWCTARAWKSNNIRIALFSGVLLGLCAFWNGAAVIAGLLILCGMAIFSDGKIDYLITAILSVLLSMLQSKIFIWDSAVQPKFQWGFLAESGSLLHIIQLLGWISGITFLGIVILAFFLKPIERGFLFASCMPLFFAFTISLTPDINVNHKYIVISAHFVSIIWAGYLVKLWRQKDKIKKIAGKAAACLLAVQLTAGGIYDFVVILKDNDRYHRVVVNLDNDIAAWIRTHIDSKDLVLTPEYSMNELTISGMMMYCGWPYYAWSAGYDTYGRADKAVQMYTTSSQEELTSLVEQEGITYIVYEEGSEFEGVKCKEDTIADTFPLVYTSESGGIRIYETK